MAVSHASIHTLHPDLIRGPHVQLLQLLMALTSCCLGCNRQQEASAPESVLAHISMLHLQQNKRFTR